MFIALSVVLVKFLTFLTVSSSSISKMSSIKIYKITIGIHLKVDGCGTGLMGTIRSEDALTSVGGILNNSNFPFTTDSEPV